MTPIFTAYYTVGTPYEEEAAALVATLDQFGVDRHVRGVPNLGSWLKNTSFKPTFIRNVMVQFDLSPVVYLDADARLLKKPDLFDKLDCDIAVHWRDGHECLSGTVYLGATDAAWHLVKDWKAECEANPGVWDQVCLDRVIKRTTGLKIYPLPASYVAIFDAGMCPPEDVVVLHTQASRKLKKVVGE